MDYFKQNPAKLVPLIGAALALLATYAPGIGDHKEAILGVVLALIGGGIHAQKAEDAKTEAALQETPADQEHAVKLIAMAHAEEIIASMQAEQPQEKTGEMPAIKDLDLDAGTVTWGR